MSALAGQWLLDTFIYTGLLIALVLLVRRQVAQLFGPGIAYALWALPLLRLVMPPLVLPAGLAPLAVPVPIAAAIASQPSGFGIVDALFAVWLVGALAFLVWRAFGYAEMRRKLLAGARPVGESGKVRLVETPGATSPVAFGIVDRVVALPPGFMAQHDREGRDLAIAHEIAHHRGHDLLANILAQPLLALHWFNPVAWWGWRAMRRDQEAACDARVMEGCSKSQRAAYAQIIAGFAAGQHLALAAPMACPVRGEKSIVHRLRSLSMTQVSARRRRLGIAVLTSAVLALPATASIGYAQSEVRDPPPAAPHPSARPETPIAAAPPTPPAPPLQSILPATSEPLVLPQAHAQGAPPVPPVPPLPPAPPKPEIITAQAERTLALAPAHKSFAQLETVVWHVTVMHNGGERTVVYRYSATLHHSGAGPETEGRRLMPEPPRQTI